LDFEAVKAHVSYDFNNNTFAIGIDGEGDAERALLATLKEVGSKPEFVATEFGTYIRVPLPKRK
jgi:hypothetical protein